MANVFDPQWDEEQDRHALGLLVYPDQEPVAYLNGES